MRATDLPIPRPCSVSWESMTGDDRRRLCSQCQEHVHDVSAMTEREARRVAQEGTCVQYRVDRGGSIVFRPSRRARIAALAGTLVSGVAFASGSIPEVGEPREATTETASPSVLDRLRSWWVGTPAVETTIAEVTQPVEVVVEPTPLVEEPIQHLRGKIKFVPRQPAPGPQITTPSTEP